MRQGDMSPPVPERVANPRIREDYEDAFSRAWFNYCRKVFPHSVRKTGTNIAIHSLSTYQCGILFNNMGSFSRKSEFQKAENLGKPVTKDENFNVAELSFFRELW